MNKLYLVTSLLSLTALGACSSGNISERVPASGSPDVRHTTYLSQNWDQASRQKFYFGAQGSHLMPYDWAKAMENEDDQKSFLTSANLSRFGYIPQAPTAENPDGLPVGFTRDSHQKKAQLGINCAACHTSEITYRGNVIRVDGGASLSDFQGFVNSMDKAIYATAADEAKFNRFAARVLGNKDSEDGRNQLRKELHELLSQRKAWQELNGTKMQYGHGRNDAFGIIFNQVLAKDLKHEKGGAPIRQNAREPNAPVSYPVLWDAPNHDIVQWIGIARNNLEEKGPLSRNIGQVLGVFGYVNFDQETKFLKGYCSSAKRSNLEMLENQVKTLWSPKWPEAVLGAIDQAKAKAGRKHFEARCVKCHTETNREDPKRIIKASMVPISVVKTDLKVAAAAANRTALTGQLKGKKLSVAEGRPMEAIEPASVVLRHAVAGALVGSISFLTCSGDIETSRDTIITGWRNVVRKSAAGLFTKAEMEKAGTMDERLAANRELFMRYKARPLNGIWSSAPFFHNGSVKSLREVLLPASERSKTFSLGCSDFDPASVGLDCSGGPVFDTSVDGNGNGGHEFGASLSEAERGELLEYLKTL